jgi:hypothetical protein
LLLVVVLVVVDQQTEDLLTYTTRQKEVDLVVVEVDIMHRTHILEQTATIIHQLPLFILLLHLDKEIQVVTLLEELLILEQVVVDRVQLENPTTQELMVDLVDRELNCPPHSEIQLLMLVILDLVAPNTLSRVVVEEDPTLLVERVVHGMDLHFFLVVHILVQETVIMQLLTMQKLTLVLEVVEEELQLTDMAVVVDLVSSSSHTQPDKYLKT